MRMRFCATMRRPAFSMTALTAPVRFRSVASGLMMEKVRSMAMTTRIYGNGEIMRCGAYSDEAPCPQAPFALARLESLMASPTLLGDRPGEDRDRGNSR